MFILVQGHMVSGANLLLQHAVLLGVWYLKVVCGPSV